LLLFPGFGRVDVGVKFSAEAVEAPLELGQVDMELAWEIEDSEVVRGEFELR
jgi:hypothetical protein